MVWALYPQKHRFFFALLATLATSKIISCVLLRNFLESCLPAQKCFIWLMWLSCSLWWHLSHLIWYRMLDQLHAWLRKKVRRCYHMMSVPQTTWENSPGFPPSILHTARNQKLPQNEPMLYVTLWLVKTLYHDHMCSRYTSLAANGSTAASVCMMYLHFSCYSMLWGWVSHKWPIQL